MARNLVLFSGNSHPELSGAIADRLGISLGDCKLSKFSNNETSVQVLESVRDVDVYIIQSGCGHVNDHLMEMLIMVSACKTASASKVTVVMPCFPYARQPDAPYKRNGQPRRLERSKSPATILPLVEQQEDRQQAKLNRLRVSSAPGGPLFTSNSLDAAGVASAQQPNRVGPRLQVASSGDEQSGAGRVTLISSPMVSDFSSIGLVKTGYRHWVARSGTLVANMIMAAGADHIITMDLHDPQFQGFFDIPVDNLFGSALMVKYIKEKIHGYRDSIVVSPDAGGAKRAANIAHKLGMEFAMIHKERNKAHHNQHGGMDTGPLALTESMVLVGNVSGRICILVDDIADTSNTITKAADILVNRGAIKVLAIVTHGVLSGNAVQRVLSSKINQLIVSNTVPQAENLKLLGNKLAVFDVAPIFAEAIRRIHHGESVSYLFEPVDI